MSKKLLLDLAERAGWTFAQAFAATFVVTGGTASAKAAGIAGVAAVLSFVKGVAATRVGAKDSAATLPAV